MKGILFPQNLYLCPLIARKAELKLPTDGRNVNEAQMAEPKLPTDGRNVNEAQMAELVDALVSGTSDRKVV